MQVTSGAERSEKGECIPSVKTWMEPWTLV